MEFSDMAILAKYSHLDKKDFPNEMIEVCKRTAGLPHNFDDFEHMTSTARNYISSNEYKAVYFQSSTFCGITCLNDGTIFKINLMDAYSSIVSIQDENRKNLFLKSLKFRDAQEALVVAMETKHAEK
jgi:hypothetical protein